MQDFQWCESDSGYDRCLPQDMASIDAHTWLGLTEIFFSAGLFSRVSFCHCAVVAQLQRTDRSI